MTSACFTISMPSVCSMPAKGEKPGAWPSLPMRSRLMAPVPRTSVRSVWICRQATKLACVLKTHRGFRIQETLRELFHSAQSAAQAEPLLDRWYDWARRLPPGADQGGGQDA